MVTFDERFYTEWVAHSHDDELIQEYVALEAFSCVPFFPESSLSDVVLDILDILLKEIASRFISVSGSIALNEAYQAHFFSLELQESNQEQKSLPFFDKLCYTPFVAAPRQAKEGGVVLEFILSFIIAVMADVVSHYINKWLDGDR